MPAVPAGPGAPRRSRGVSTRRARPGLRARRPGAPRRADHRARRRLRQRPGRARRADRRHASRPTAGAHAAARRRRSGRAGRRAPRSPAASPASPRTATAPARSRAMSLTENAILEGYRAAAFSRRGWIDWRAARGFAEAHHRATTTSAAPGPRRRIGLLSGGNMQKLILGRALVGRAADHPRQPADPRPRRRRRRLRPRAAPRGARARRRGPADLRGPRRGPGALRRDPRHQRRPRLAGLPRAAA